MNFVRRWNYIFITYFIYYIVNNKGKKVRHGDTRSKKYELTLEINIH